MHQGRLGVCRQQRPLSILLWWRLLIGRKPSGSCGESHSSHGNHQKCFLTYARCQALLLACQPEPSQLHYPEDLTALDLEQQLLQDSTEAATFEEPQRCWKISMLEARRSLTRNDASPCREGAEAAKALLRRVADGIQGACRQAGGIQQLA